MKYDLLNSLLIAHFTVLLLSLTISIIYLPSDNTSVRVSTILENVFQTGKSLNENPASYKSSIASSDEDQTIWSIIERKLQIGLFIQKISTFILGSTIDPYLVLGDFIFNSNPKLFWRL